MNQKNNKIEEFEGEFLHPSLDIKRGILTLGFRYIAKNREEKEIFLIAKADNLKISSEDTFELDGKRYFLETKGRKLGRIEERWSIQELKGVSEEYKLPNLQEIYREIKELLKKYIELEEEIDYSLIAVWIIGTYFFPIFSTYPFLHIKAPKRSGKSQCLSFLKQIILVKLLQSLRYQLEMALKVKSKLVLIYRLKKEILPAI